MESRQFQADTICALATPKGRGSVGMIRISGCNTEQVIKKIFSPHSSKINLAKTNIPHREAILGRIHDNNTVLDQVILVFYQGPASYTTEDMAEIFCHGNPVIAREILELLIRHNVKPAKAGEFTERAFLGGRIDLTQAEAIDSIIKANSKKEVGIWLKHLDGTFKDRIEGLRQRLIDLLADIEAEIDFVEEEEIFASSESKIGLANEILSHLEHILKFGRLGSQVEEGFKVAIIGKPNVGKSSLMNLLLNRDRSIISNIPGTTRDVITETIEIGEIAFRFYDTAGLRESSDTLESIGIQKTREALKESEYCLFLIDALTGFDKEDQLILELLKNKNFYYVINKIDLAERASKTNWQDLLGSNRYILFSAKTGYGLDQLESILKSIPAWENEDENELLIIHERIKFLLLNIKLLLAEFLDTVKKDSPQEIQSIPLREAIRCMGEVTGKIIVEDILDSIFRRFCIGK